MASGTINAIATKAEVDGKANKASNPIVGNFASLDANGNVVDSGKSNDSYFWVTDQTQSITSAKQTKMRTNLGLGGASTCSVVNNSTTTSSGTVLDGRMGKTLMDAINARGILKYLGNVPANSYKRIRCGTTTGTRFVVIASATSSSRMGLAIGYLTSNTRGALVISQGEDVAITQGNYYIQVKNNHSSAGLDVYVLMLTSNVGDLTFNT